MMRQEPPERFGLSLLEAVATKYKDPRVVIVGGEDGRLPEDWSITGERIFATSAEVMQFFICKRESDYTERFVDNILFQGGFELIDKQLRKLHDDVDLNAYLRGVGKPDYKDSLIRRHLINVIGFEEDITPYSSMMQFRESLDRLEGNDLTNRLFMTQPVAEPEGRYAGRICLHNANGKQALTLVKYKILNNPFFEE